MNQTDSKTRPNFDDTFRRDALNHWLTSGKPVQPIADGLGIRGYLLYAWKNRFTPGLGEAQTAATKPATLADAQARLEAAEREIRHLREQRDILKKTLGIISETPL